MAKKGVIIAVSIVGLVISLLLLLWYYYPQMNIQGLSCSSNNGCEKLASSKYSTILNIPLSVFGIYLYLFTLYTSIIQLILNYETEINRLYNLLLLLLYISVLLVDAVLFSKMIKNSVYCFYCIGTYVVNLLIFSVYLLEINKTKVGKVSFILEYIRIFKNRDARVIMIMHLFSVILMIPAVDSINIYVKNYAGRRHSMQVLNDNISNIANKSSLDTSILPDSLIAVGSKEPVVIIYLFSDFLCSHCLQWHEVESKILEEYGDRVAIKYYIYPMDSRCNKYVSRTINPYSCEVNSAMILAAQNGLYEKLSNKYFEMVNGIGGRFSDKDLKFFDDFFEKNGVQTDYRQNLSIRNYLIKNIEYASRLAIHSTPTIIINNHPVRGMFEYEVYKTIIDSEILKVNKQ